ANIQLNMHRNAAMPNMWPIRRMSQIGQEALGPPSAGAAGFEVCGPAGAVACSGFGGVEPEVLSLFWSLPGWLGVLTRTP
uniref:hypothetical protein n=1 Tax=Rhodococcus qingshengii TaxID=334542 RepID=UPI001C4E0134